MATDKEFTQVKSQVRNYEPDPDVVATIDDDQIIKADPQSREAAKHASANSNPLRTKSVPLVW